MSGVRKTTKVVLASAQPDTCKLCDQKCCWFKAANTKRWLLFNLGVPVVRQKGPYLYLDFRGVHWHSCPSRVATW